MSYIHKPTGQYPLSERDIRAAFPNTSFPEPFVAPDEYAWVFPSPQPAHDPVIQTVREIAPALSVKGEYEQQWEVVPKYATPEEEAAAIAADQEAKAAAAREEAKRKRAEAVANIQVTTSAGHTFDGDEESQTRMSRAVIGMLSSQTESSGVVTLPWVLSDNTVIQVDAGELTEALTLAGMEQARIWVIE